MASPTLAQVWQDAHLNLLKAVENLYHILCKAQEGNAKLKQVVEKAHEENAKLRQNAEKKKKEKKRKEKGEC
jgi:hypothetical protein